MSDAPAWRYKLLDRIAVGGTAEVFRALASSSDGREESVVLKRVLPQLARDERFRRLFGEEARVVAALDHPNIVRIVDYGELDGTCFIALEAVDGRDLGALLRAVRDRGEGIPPVLAARIVAEVARALHFAHEQVSAAGVPLQIIHRDVSPQNILVSFQGDVKLTDFGIARSSLSDDAAGEGGLRGKLDYMAPEQAAADRSVDHRSDLFALGCVLYELLAGRPPFRGAHDAETLDRLRALRPLRPPRELDAPVELRAVLEHLLRRLPSERFQQAHELSRHLDAYLERHGAALGARELGAWAQRLADETPEVSTPEASVDDAVRALLGDPLDDDPNDTRDRSRQLTRERAPTGQVPTLPPARTSTAQLARPDGSAELDDGPHARGPGTAETPSPPRRALRYLPWALMLVAALAGSATLGWWLHHRHADPAVDTAGDAAAARASRSAPDARVTTTRPRQDAGRLPAPRWVRSSPSGARVRVDGIDRGQTPVALALPRVPFVLELRKLGYRDHRARHEALDDQPIVVHLRRAGGRAATPGKVGYLTVNSLPWTRVYLQGRYVGNTPVLRRPLRAGRHRITLRDGRGALRKRFDAQIEPGQLRAYTFDLRSRSR